MYIEILAVTALLMESECQGMCTPPCPPQHQICSTFEDRNFLFYLVTTISSQIHFSRITSRLTNILTGCTWRIIYCLQHPGSTRAQPRFDFPGLFWKQFGRELLTKNTTENTTKANAKTEKTKGHPTNCRVFQIFMLKLTWSYGILLIYASAFDVAVN